MCNQTTAHFRTFHHLTEKLHVPSLEAPNPPARGLLHLMSLLSLLFSRFIQAAPISVPFLFMVEYSMVCLYCILFIHSPANRHSGCFHILALVNNTFFFFFKHLCMNFGGIFAFISLAYTPRNEIAASQGNSMFSHLRNSCGLLIIVLSCPHVLGWTTLSGLLLSPLGDRHFLHCVQI